MEYKKLTRHTEWKPEIELNKGLIKTVDWCLDNKEWTNTLISSEYINFYKKNTITDNHSLTK